MSRHAEAHVVVEPIPKNVRVARQFLRTALQKWGRSHLADTAVLLASELLTNVILHVGSPGELCVARSKDRVRVEVRDSGALLPSSARYAVDGTTGRGLMLVSALSDDWGVEPDGHGKVVWFELDDTNGGTGMQAEARGAGRPEDDRRASSARVRPWDELWDADSGVTSVVWPPGRAALPLVLRALVEGGR